MPGERAFYAPVAARDATVMIPLSERERRLVAHTARQYTALLLASRIPAQPAIVQAGPLVVDLIDDRALLDGETVPLSVGSWRLLACLALHCGEVVEHDRLIAYLWPSSRSTGGLKLARSNARAALRALVGRLRKQLGRGCYLVVNERQRGWRLLEGSPEVR